MSDRLTTERVQEIKKSLPIGSRQLYAACLRKRYYKSYDYAEKIALRRVEKEPGLSLGVYGCQFCGHYHLTSRPADFGLQVIVGTKMVIDVVP